MILQSCTSSRDEVNNAVDGKTTGCLLGGVKGVCQWQIHDRRTLTELAREPASVRDADECGEATVAVGPAGRRNAAALRGQGGYRITQ